jgi:hypothetical protein
MAASQGVGLRMPSLSVADFLHADGEALAALAADGADGLVIPQPYLADVTENLAVLQGHARLLMAALEGAPEGAAPGPFRP